MIENVGFVIHAGEIMTPEAVESFRGDPAWRSRQQRPKYRTPS
jgi:hypothetical protein